VKFQKLALPHAEPPDVYRALRSDPHPLQRGQVRNWGNDQLAVAFKSDEAPVKQVVDGRRKEEAVLAVQPLCVVGIPPACRGSRSDELGS